MMDYDHWRRDDDADEGLRTPLPEMSRAALASQPEHDVEEAEDDDAYATPDAPLFAEDLVVRVLTLQQDEFLCSRCSLVHHRSQQATSGGGRAVHVDCASRPAAEVSA
ncbi:DUF4193 family protein [Georgenia muralis]|uniref:Uncharacterized protein DUF4193 n=1 Tax=Georgenia muralis TaxID=154117 RepID=A0A3N4Z8C0_9MICO|nr:DUF4193 family protein [Georgenia muralis]RPF28254.1 uncharacterized protein DUF4193 [Georgenia muralis]